MNSYRCAQCGLVNFSTNATCRRCGTAFERVVEVIAESAPQITLSRRLTKGAIQVFAAVCGILLFAYLSLMMTSDPLTADQRQIVNRAIDILDQQGFGSDAFLLRRLVSFRSNDNWWNRWVGHGQAYAATNFPFEVVTLYPDFFHRAADDVERAMILLHETYHLRGYGEPQAHRQIWLHKHKLGWTQEKYGQTRVWKNVREFTARFAPELFRCGPNGQSDCMP
jgi:hypothetical protein